MSEACRGMMQRPRSAWWLIGPGALLVLLGVVVLIEPRVLAWLVAIALIVMGAGIIMMARFMRRFGRRHHSGGH